VGNADEDTDSALSLQ